MKANDSAEITLDMFCNLGYALSKQLHDGEPLGTGSEPSATYNAFLYQTGSGGFPIPARSDSRIQYGDFGYIPLWQPNNLSGRVGFRFLPALQGRISIGCNLEQVDATARASGDQLALGEVLLRWTPRNLKGCDINIGRLLWAGTYSAIFDQMPLEQFFFDGAVIGYTKGATNDITISTRLGLGRKLAGRSVAYSDTTGFFDLNFQYLGEIWHRLHGIGSIATTYKNKFTVKLVGGYQKVPELTTEIKVGTLDNSKRSIIIPESDGWHAGVELNGTIRKTEHYITLAYGRDDVLLGWSSPLFVDTKEVHRITLSQYESDFGIYNFQRKGSSLMHGAWWMNLRAGRLKGAAGVWAMYNIPADIKATYLFEYLDTVEFKPCFDTVSVGTQRSISAKGAVDFSYRITGPLHLGLRGDVFHYNNPNAHSNVYEFGRAGNDFFYKRDSPAKWENEAVSCRVVTPYLMLNVSNTLSVNGAYAFAFYDKNVLRQNTFASHHGNLILSAQLNWRFAKMKTE